MYTLTDLLYKHLYITIAINQVMRTPKSKTKENLIYEEDIKKINKILKTPQEKLLFKVLLFTGMRISEFLHFKKDWISKDWDYIQIPKEQKCDCKECKRLREGIWKPKTAEGVRTIPLLSEIKIILKGYFNNYDTIMEFYPYGRVECWKIIKQLGKKAELKQHLFPHALRGSHATILAQHDFKEFDLTSAMGWKSIQTARDYIKFSGKQLKKKYDALGKDAFGSEE